VWRLDFFFTLDYNARAVFLGTFITERKEGAMFIRTDSPSSVKTALSGARQLVDLLASADIIVNGERPWDIQVHDGRFYGRVFANPALALGESYVDGWWDCGQLDEFFYRVLNARLDRKVRPGVKLTVQKLLAQLFNQQTRRGSKKIATEHYDLSIDLYTAFLDPYNQYTCGYFKDTDDLNKAQEQKLDLICRKLNISPSDHVLDIGCGWGGFAKFAAEHYGCRVTGVTISREQQKYALEFCKGLPVEILLLDYRDLDVPEHHLRYDKILICGMIEHVGYKNYRRIMRIVSHCLKEDGLFLLHTIGGNVSSPVNQNIWMEKYIFPNSAVPSLRQLSEAFEGLFVVEDLHNFSAYYEKTLLKWWENFQSNWHTIASQFGDRFFRMWKYYLLSCAGAFRARSNQLWQIVLSKYGVPGGYQSIR
jgi:cyclopropane-fatty-acyl-phospholipid synthase